MLWKWATVVGLSMTPALIAGQSAAAAAGIAFGFDPVALVIVIAVSGYVEGLALGWIAGQPDKIGRVHRWLAKMRTPRAVRFADRWGPWGGLLLGGVMVGQEPVLVALRALDVKMRRIALPLAVANLIFAVLYYAIVKFGWDQAMSM
jgi:hypothetical protein